MPGSADILPDRVRPPAVAGTFYPDDPAALRAVVQAYLADARERAQTILASFRCRPKALIVPHAGYACSGPVAGSAYALLAPGLIRRVVMLGPAHHGGPRGLTAPAAAAFRTPLGTVPVDRAAIERVLPWAEVSDGPHDPEHCLEVQLPFLLEVLGDFTLVPMLSSACAPGDIAPALDLLWGGPDTLLVLSSDLSHYHPGAVARRLDQATAAAIERMAPQEIAPEQACGRPGIQALLTVARRRGLRALALDLRNSGDTCGPRDRVVGYGAFAFFEP